jgi:hypothetical protein
MAAQRARQGVAAARSPGVTATPPPLHLDNKAKNLTKKRNIEFLGNMRHVALASLESERETHRRSLDDLPRE